MKVKINDKETYEINISNNDVFTVSEFREFASRLTLISRTLIRDDVQEVLSGKTSEVKQRFINGGYTSYKEISNRDMVLKLLKNNETAPSGNKLVAANLLLANEGVSVRFETPKKLFAFFTIQKVKHNIKDEEYKQ